MGSVAESFLAQTPCDVLAVRQIHEQARWRFNSIT
jgi:hypothetical protein